VARWPGPRPRRLARPAPQACKARSELHRRTHVARSGGEGWRKHRSHRRCAGIARLLRCGPQRAAARGAGRSCAPIAHKRTTIKASTRDPPRGRASALPRPIAVWLAQIRHERAGRHYEKVGRAQPRRGGWDRNPRVSREDGGAQIVRIEVASLPPPAGPQTSGLQTSGPQIRAPENLREFSPSVHQPSPRPSPRLHPGINAGGAIMTKERAGDRGLRRAAIEQARR
jgi:hypothetical protein